MLAAASIVIAAGLKLGYWRFIDAAAPTSTAGTATGLGSSGSVRLFEAPHTSENYLLKEMGFVIARKHATKLRRIALDHRLRPALPSVSGPLLRIGRARNRSRSCSAHRWERSAYSSSVGFSSPRHGTPSRCTTVRRRFDRLRHRVNHMQSQDGDKANPWAVLRKETKFECPYFSVRVDAVSLGGGPERAYNSIRMKTYGVLTVPIDEEGCTTLIGSTAMCSIDTRGRYPAAALAPGCRTSILQRPNSARKPACMPITGCNYSMPAQVPGSRTSSRQVSSLWGPIAATRILTLKRGSRAVGFPLLRPSTWPWRADRQHSGIALLLSHSSSTAA